MAPAASGVVGFAAPGAVFVIDSVPVIVVVVAAPPGASLPAGVVVPVIVVVPVTVPEAGGTIVAGNGVAVGCATGGVVSHERMGSTLIEASVYSLSLSGNLT